MPENIFGHLQRQDQSRRRHESNTARAGSQYLTWETSGTGDLVPKKSVSFDLPFFSEPAVTYGHAYIKAPNLDHYTVPQVSGSVIRWVRNRRGFYVGAYFVFRVDSEVRPGVASSVPRYPKPVIIHHFVFTGMSYREMSSQVNEAANDEAIKPLNPPV